MFRTATQELVKVLIGTGSRCGVESGMPSLFFFSVSYVAGGACTKGSLARQAMPLGLHGRRPGFVDDVLQQEFQTFDVRKV